jgi:hypothetical protein
VVRTLVAAAIVIVASTGCTQVTPTPSTMGQVRVVPGSSGFVYDGVAWVGRGLIVAKDDAQGESRLEEMDPVTGDAGMQRSPSAPADCTRIDEAAPSTATGALTWVMKCERPGAPPRLFQILEAVGLAGVPRVRASVETRLAIRTIDLRSGSIRTSYGSVICETIAEVRATQIVPLEIEVSGPGGTFITGGDPTVDCVDTGRALLPASRGPERPWAFLASTIAIGREGQARLGLPFDVYLVEASARPARLLPAAIVDPTELEWTPDGLALIVSGVTESGRELTWRMNPESGELREVLPFGLRSLSFSPDGEMATALRKVESANIRAAEVVTFPASLLGE